MSMNEIISSLTHVQLVVVHLVEYFLDSFTKKQVYIPAF